MKKNSFLVVIGLTLLIGLNACCYTLVPRKVIYSDELSGTLEELDVRASIHVKSDGQLVFVDGEGNPLTKCVLPQPEIESERTGKTKNAQQQVSSDPVICQGLDKGSAITSIQSVSILKSNSTNCIFIGHSSDGLPVFACW